MNQSAGLVEALGLSVGDIVQELGWDDDIDFQFRNGLEDELGEPLLAEDDREPVEAVLLWWRSDEGDAQDLADALVDAQTNLAENGAIWLLVPKPAQELHVPPSDIEEACRSTALRRTSQAGVSDSWSATRLEVASPL
ncbi:MULTISPECIES: DUF3052 domain-containing protein [Auritidibacter]|uniref:DUF3052 domain-containing protein n=1 Tax=Auritidibacter TaxID=1160973 RepID=UPI000D734FBF|nr:MULTISPECIES: DUF3052 domain-containing protein [Auritidibacter]PXA79294.1 DUF3052 domain-containing protein [Auritidibacter sp. NML120779]AXR73331.1 DUF3052 domain-containing protein [Auritidibacter sp. NML130574]NIH70895.1 hypothetical protein [Auritidibacter ignavus]PXA76176.1 DUF3052 domain-containing protein [Auritidibacter sp. NML100628]PXA82086.1 DUF3052 domain-containing protein [Auritidibacter sp. NML120636]